jgi:hypothetical protein
MTPEAVLGEFIAKYTNSHVDLPAKVEVLQSGG